MPTGFGKEGATTGGMRGSPQPPTSSYGFQMKKRLILAHCFVEKGHAVSAVTVECGQRKNIFAAYV